MVDQPSDLAARANAAFYDLQQDGYERGAPHIKHAALRRLCRRLVEDVYASCAQDGREVRVLDLGAGEGGVTLSFLELGASVTAVDVSARQLDRLTSKAGRWRDRLQVRCEDLAGVLAEDDQRYDIVSAVSLLHHVPDYVGLVRAAMARVRPNGCLFTFEDPLRYDSLRALTRHVARLGYFSWRIFQTDVAGGLKRRLRRSRGQFTDDASDSQEYHVIRNGVDQDALARLFSDEGWDARFVRYFSSQSRITQSIGTSLGLENYFAIVARRPKPNLEGP
jgi:2-polyprenyl-6-hydroxyphenyl methylase / 3-demethylubiquinone-9 3-methyltransferase